MSAMRLSLANNGGMRSTSTLSAPGPGARLLAAAAVLALVLLGAVQTTPAAAAETRPGLSPCRLPGVEHDAWCGVVQRPLNPTQPQGTQIAVHYAVLPALSRNRKPDPVFFFAGGPGQSAIDLAGPVSAMLQRLSNRRDIVLVDQRGTGRSAPLKCADEAPTQPLAESVGTAALLTRLAACRSQLQAQPHGDLRHYATWVAMQDAEAVRVALGAPQVNIVGSSYGTRAVLEFQRQFPQAVRRAVADGVAPPDMVLPAAFSADNQAALDAVFAACAAEPRCQARWPKLRDDWRRLLAGLPLTVQLLHPVSGRSEQLTLDRDALLGLVRGPLYAPLLASALPLAIGEAARGRFEPLAGLASATAGNSRQAAIAEGLHFSVVCSEDLPLLPAAKDKPGADFGDSFLRLYRQVCDSWPRASVPPAFYTVPAASHAVLLLSGGADPVTPPRHAERVARQLGALARVVTVPQAGHGVLALPCMRDALFRFVDADSDELALKVGLGCAQSLPRPPAFVPAVVSREPAGPTDKP